MKLHSDTYDNYKSSESEWTEQIPAEWQEKRVKDLFRMVTNAAPENNDYELLSLYASIGVRPRKDLEARGNKASSTDGYWIVKKGDIVVNKLLAWMGSVGISKYEGVTSPAYDILRKVTQEVDPRYYSYLFRTETAKKIFKKNSRGIMDMRLRLYFDKLGAITVPVPSYVTQHFIANYIDTKATQIDTKIKILNEKTKLYRKLRQSIIDDVVTCGLNKDVKTKDSDVKGIGEIPNTWRIMRLKETGFLYSGLTGKRGEDFTDDDEYSSPFVPFTNIANNFLLSINDLKSVIVYPVETQNHVQKNDLFFLMSSEDYGDLGKCSLLIEDMEVKTYLNSFCKGFRITKKMVSPIFLAYLLHSSTYRSNLSNEGKGFTRINLKMEKIKDIKLILPDLEEQEYIASLLNEKTSQIDSVLNNISMQIEKLKELRIAMINDAVTGNIKVVGEEKNEGQAA